MRVKGMTWNQAVPHPSLPISFRDLIENYAFILQFLMNIFRVFQHKLRITLTLSMFEN